MLTRQQAVEHRTFSDSVAAYVSFAFGPAPLSSSKIFGTPIPNAEQVSHSRAISIDFDRFRPISTDSGHAECPYAKTRSSTEGGTHAEFGIFFLRHLYSLFTYKR